MAPSVRFELLSLRGSHMPTVTRSVASQAMDTSVEARLAAAEEKLKQALEAMEAQQKENDSLRRKNAESSNTTVLAHSEQGEGEEPSNVESSLGWTEKEKMHDEL